MKNNMSHLWKPVYEKSEIAISCVMEKDIPFLVVEVAGYHKEQMPMADIFEKSGCTKNYNWTFERKAKAIVDYVIEHALFPYPVQELM